VVSQYILKPRNQDETDYFNRDGNNSKRYYPYIAVNEHLFMSFAKNELGFDVPYSGIIKAKDTDYHYITKRYDRLDGVKYNQVDFAQVLNIQSKNKYKGSSEQLFEAINIKLSTKEAKLEAIRFYFYSALIQNADLHLKNIGALEISNDKYILTPLYDIASMGVYNGQTYDLGLMIYNNKPKNIRLEAFVKLAKIVGISELEFKKVARKITEIYIERIPQYIKKLQKFEKENSLPMQKSRKNKMVQFSTRLENSFNEKVISLKKLGIIDALALTKKAGGVLNVQGKK